MKDTQCTVLTDAISLLVRGICFHKDALKIEDRSEHDVYQLYISPHMADMPLIVGPEGRLVKALRYVIRQAAKKLELRLPADETKCLVLEDSYVGDAEPPRPFKLNETFDHQELDSILDKFKHLVFESPEKIQLERRTSNGEIKIYVMGYEPKESAIIAALGDIIYPYGYRNGMKVKVKESRLSKVLSEPGKGNVLGTGSVLGQK